MTRKQFTFYDSFYQAIQRIQDNGERAMAYDALCDYALLGKEPSRKRLPESVKLILDLTRPTLDAARRKAMARLLSEKKQGREHPAQSGEADEN